MALTISRHADHRGGEPVISKDALRPAGRDCGGRRTNYGTVRQVEAQLTRQHTVIVDHVIDRKWDAIGWKIYCPSVRGRQRLGAADSNVVAHAIVGAEEE